tara:strand:+ start:389 stop:847 length:459 start_codon:yes stop_codon:yes gene_type:complete
MLINMSLEKKIMNDIKEAMLAKNNLRLNVCRAIKSEILIVKTQKKSQDLSNDKELEILQKLLKQRKESERIYQNQNRLDLANDEKNQANIIAEYLPKPYTQDELIKLVDELINELGISSKQEMGKLIAEVMRRSKGRADGKTISDCVKERLI